MRRRIIRSLSVSLLALTTVAFASADWELRRDALAPERDRPPVEDHAVTVTVGAEPRWFPRHLNELGIEAIRLRFQETGGVAKRLSLVWEGGTQGPDGFVVSVDGSPRGTSRTVDTARYPHMWFRDDFDFLLAPGAEHRIEIRSSPELRSPIQFAGIRLSSPEAGPYQPLCYESIGSLERYERALGGPGVLIEQEHLCVFAPRSHEQAARNLAAFLERAYAIMRDLYGTDTMFKFSVELYPAGNERGWGGISGEGTIGYPLEALERFARLGTGDVRGFAGFTEEMSHGFKSLYRCDGTYEALGVAVQEDVVRRLVTPQVADAFWLPEHAQWEETHRAYLAAGCRNPDPARYPWNVLYTRILNHVFLLMRTEYGPQLWPDFFRLVRRRDYPLHRASATERMGVYADLFSELMGRDMRAQFTRWGIDLDADPPWGWETNHPPSGQ